MFSRTMKLSAHRWIMQCIRMGIIFGLALAASHFLLVLATGGYSVALGPWRISVHHLNGPLLLLLGLSMAALWLQGKQHGMPAGLRLQSPGLLFLGVVFIYSLNGRTLTVGDTIPASYLPFSILREFDLDFDEFPSLYDPKIPYFLQRSGDHLVSIYPPWAGVFAVPVYLLPVLWGQAPEFPMIQELEKLSATLIVALSVVLLLLALRRLTGENIAYAIALVYALGTSSFSSSSQALWQHGPSQLCLTLMIYWLVKGIGQPRYSVYAGLALASAIICRPPNALLAIPIIAYVLLERRAQLVGFFMAGLPPWLAFSAYNVWYFGSPFTTGVIGAVGPSQLWSGASSLFSTSLHEGLSGVLGSPSRGLFVYSPIFLVSVAGIAMIWRQPQQVLLKCLSFAPVLIILLISKWVMWWGGHSYGPRLLADITPILCLYLYLPFERARSGWLLKGTIAGLAILSIGLHALGVFSAGDWNGHHDIDRHPERLWSWTDSPPVYYMRPLVMDASKELRRRLWSLPTSLDVPQKLAASYRLMNLAPGLALPLSALMTCSLEVVNEGDAIWLARTKQEKGEVRLGWRWYRREDEVQLNGEGRARLRFDVFPGETYQFHPSIETPAEPGNYILELGLVSELVTWFSDRGVAPLRFDVRVLSADGHTPP